MSDNISEIWIAGWLGSVLYLITRTVVSQVIREPVVLHYWISGIWWRGVTGMAGLHTPTNPRRFALHPGSVLTLE
jgi:hypothetical protein